MFGKKLSKKIQAQLLSCLADEDAFADAKYTDLTTTEGQAFLQGYLNGQACIAKMVLEDAKINWHQPADQPRKVLVIDFDDTICELRKPNQPYFSVRPKPKVSETLIKLVQEGWRITIHTASGMGTFNGDLEQINKVRRPEIVEWLNRNAIPYHELIMGKPLGQVYIDDKGLKFTTWEDIKAKL